MEQKKKNQRRAKNSGVQIWLLEGTRVQSFASDYTKGNKLMGT